MTLRRPTLSRRALLQGALCLGPLALAAHPRLAFAEAPSALAQIERAHGGRLGVVALRSGVGVILSHRADERFALCSTFKVLLTGFVLSRVDRGEERLDRALPVTQASLVANSPITTTRVGQAMPIADLCHATMTTSDNCAANLLLGETGGPEALTAWLRSLGDPSTRLDRAEPELNLVKLSEGDARDTTTPAAMAATLETLTLGAALTPASREILIGWLRAATTGLGRLREGWPADWRAGDKTGTGPDGPTNDVAVAWPPGAGALVVTAYYDRPGYTMAESSAVLAEVGRLLIGV